jgi:hypothetical protein
MVDGFFPSGTKQQHKHTKATVHWHSSESMKEVPNESARLLIGASVFLGKQATWNDYAKLYQAVYNKEGWRVVRPDGYFVVIQTDAYIDRHVLPRNTYLPAMLCSYGWELIDVKVWKRRAADFFQPPFSQVFVFAKDRSLVSRKQLNKCNAYFQGVWDYKQTKSGAHNAYPDGLCRLLVDAFTAPGDMIVDPFCGTGRLLGVAARLGRRAVGYEIDPSLKPIVQANIT